jgi:hypothetical protein
MDESATCKVTDRREALQGSATVLFTDPRPRIPITFMKARLVNGFSIAFEVTQGHLDGEVRHLIKLRMREITASQFGWNESAQVAGMLAPSNGDQGANHPKDHQQGPDAVDRRHRSMRMLSQGSVRGGR